MASASIFLVDDDREFCSDLSAVLDGRFDLHLAHDGPDFLNRFENERTDLILLDVDFGSGQMSGLEILERVRALGGAPPVIMLSGNHQLSTVVGATKMGAFHYAAKPVDLPELLNLIDQALAASHRGRQIQAQKDELGRLTGEFVAGDDRTFRMLEQVDKVAATSATVLITGESGTGKEMVARRLHQGSDRSEGTFVGINCGAVPADIIESEIFGHVKGAFTGADKLRIGKFEMAVGGTLFLDEVGECPLPFQVKLLRALGERVITRLGSNQDVAVDTRIIAATSRNLEEAVTQAAFREDLFYRLNLYRIHLAPLRERPGDVLPLARHFLVQAAAREGRPIEGFSPAVEKRMQQERWPGNVRELRNFVERAVINCSGGLVGLGDMFHDGSGQSAAQGPFAEAKDTMVRAWETQYVTARLAESGGNVTKAAELSGMSRQNFQRKIRDLQVDPADFQD